MTALTPSSMCVLSRRVLSSLGNLQERLGHHDCASPLPIYRTNVAPKCCNRRRHLCAHARKYALTLGAQPLSRFRRVRSRFLQLFAVG